MSDADDERRLRRLVEDAVADVEPTDRLAQIRARTRAASVDAETSSGRVRRRRSVAVLGAAAAVTLVIGLVGVAVNQTDHRQPAARAEPSTAVDPEDATPTITFPVYFLGDTARGPGLYRELQTARTLDPLTMALRQSVQGQADDPDYRSAWPTDYWVAHASEIRGKRIEIGLIGPRVASLPAGMTRQEARLAIQQVVYTAQASAEDGSLPVAFSTRGGQGRVLGVRVGSAMSAASPLETLSLASLDSPAEGQVVDSGVLTVAGAANGYEGTVVLELRDAAGRAVLSKPVVAGTVEDRLFPFHAELDVSEVPAGTYTLAASTEDPTGGTEGFGADTDTRTVVIE